MHEVFLSDDCVKIKKNIFEKWSIHTIFVQPLWSWGGGSHKIHNVSLTLHMQHTTFKKQNGPCNFQKS